MLFQPSRKVLLFVWVSTTGKTSKSSMGSHPQVTNILQPLPAAMLRFPAKFQSPWHVERMRTVHPEHVDPVEICRSAIPALRWCGTRGVSAHLRVRPGTNSRAPAAVTVGSRMFRSVSVSFTNYINLFKLIVIYLLINYST